MIFKAPAKINLGLHIKGKRPDGFHILESVFYKIPLFDFVELIPSKKDSFAGYNIPIPGGSEKNICLLALQTLREKGFTISSYDIHLLKNIPIGAGLGGGSSDAVAVLNAVKLLDNLSISKNQMLEIAAELGSDCPFFLAKKAALVTGRGEQIQEIDLNLAGKHLILVNPNIHISTKEAYGSLDLTKTTSDNIDWELEPGIWQEKWVNDFEHSLRAMYPELQRIKNKLKSSGAFYSSLSGSGSSVFGVFDVLPKEKLFSNEGFSEWSFSL